MAGLSGYLGNLLLKASNVKIPFTKDQVSEYIKCKESVEYFVENYINIVSLDKGLVLFDLYLHTTLYGREVTSIIKNAE